MSLTESKIMSNPVSCDDSVLLPVRSLVMNAIGNRTIAGFCEDAGLSVGYMSRLLNGKMKSTPSVRTLAKISCSSMGDDKQEVFKRLLDIYGHDIGVEEIQQEIRIAERTSEIIEEEREGAKAGKKSAIELKASVMGLMISNLMIKGVPLKSLNNFGPNETIDIGTEGYPFERLVIISGFCGNSTQATMAERDIMKQLLKCVSSQKDLPLYLILTEHKEVFDFVSDVVENSLEASAYVLLTNSNVTGFVEQKFFAAENVKAPFEFVDDANNF